MNKIIKVGGAKTTREALEEGYDAREEDLKASNNPYSWESANGRSWYRGWLLANTGQDLPSAGDDE